MVSAPWGVVEQLKPQVHTGVPDLPQVPDLLVAQPARGFLFLHILTIDFSHHNGHLMLLMNELDKC